MYISKQNQQKIKLAVNACAVCYITIPDMYAVMGCVDLYGLFNFSNT